MCMRAIIVKDYLSIVVLFKMSFFCPPILIAEQLQEMYSILFTAEVLGVHFQFQITSIL